MVVRNVLQNEKSFAFCKSLITLDVTLNATTAPAEQQPWARRIPSMLKLQKCSIQGSQTGCLIA